MKNKTEAEEIADKVIKDKCKEEIQKVLENYKCGIVMMPHLEPDGIKITMDIVLNDMTPEQDSSIDRIIETGTESSADEATDTEDVSVESNDEEE